MGVKALQIVRPALDSDEAGKGRRAVRARHGHSDALVRAGIFRAVLIAGQVAPAGIGEGLHRVGAVEPVAQQRGDLADKSKISPRVAPRKKDPQGVLVGGNGSRSARHGRKHAQAGNRMAKSQHQRLADADHAPARLETLRKSRQRRFRIGLQTHREADGSAAIGQRTENGRLAGQVHAWLREERFQAKRIPVRVKKTRQNIYRGPPVRFHRIG